MRRRALGVVVACATAALLATSPHAEVQGRGSAEGRWPGPHDATLARASVDASPTDAGPTDAGPTDAGPTDAGPTDAGLTDAGSRGDGLTETSRADGEGDAGNGSRRAQLPRWPVALGSEVVRLSRAFQGEFALYVKDLSDGSAYSYNGETPYYLASVVKVAVLREVYRQLDAGLLSLDEVLTYTADAVRDGSGVARTTAVGATLTVGELVEKMISRSDNAATDLLMERVGLDHINASLAAIGGFGEVTSMLAVRRLVYGQLTPKALALSPAQVFALAQVHSLEERARALGKAVGERPFSGKELARAFDTYYAELFNSAPMSAVVRLLEGVHRCEGLSPSSCRAMLETLKGCETGAARLKAQLPPRVTFAHKTGTQHRRLCDVGLLYLPDRAAPIAIAACAKEFQSRRAAEMVLAQLGRATVRALEEPVARRPSPVPPVASAQSASSDEQVQHRCPGHGVPGQGPSGCLERATPEVRHAVGLESR